MKAQSTSVSLNRRACTRGKPHTPSPHPHGPVTPTTPSSPPPPNLVIFCRTAASVIVGRSSALHTFLRWRSGGGYAAGISAGNPHLLLNICGRIFLIRSGLVLYGWARLGDENTAFYEEAESLEMIWSGWGKHLQLDVRCYTTVTSAWHCELCSTNKVHGSETSLFTSVNTPADEVQLQLYCDMPESICIGGRTTCFEFNLKKCRSLR